MLETVWKSEKKLCKTVWITFFRQFSKKRKIELYTLIHSTYPQCGKVVCWFVYYWFKPFVISRSVRLSVFSEFMLLLFLPKCKFTHRIPREIRTSAPTEYKENTFEFPKKRDVNSIPNIGVIRQYTLIIDALLYL